MGMTSPWPRSSCVCSGRPFDSRIRSEGVAAPRVAHGPRAAANEAAWTHGAASRRKPREVVQRAAKAASRSCPGQHRQRVIGAQRAQTPRHPAQRRARARHANLEKGPASPSARSRSKAQAKLRSAPSGHATTRQRATRAHAVRAKQKRRDRATTETVPLIGAAPSAKSSGRALQCPGRSAHMPPWRTLRALSRWIRTPTREHSRSGRDGARDRRRQRAPCEPDDAARYSPS